MLGRDYLIRGNEMVAKKFLINYAEFAISNNNGRFPNRIWAIPDTPGVLKSFPLFSQMDGFYAVRLQRKR